MSDVSNRVARCLGAAAMLACAACSSGAASAADMSAPGPDMTPVCTSDGMPIALGKHYGVRVNLSVNVKIPSGCTDGCVLDEDAMSRLLLLVDVTQTGQSLITTARPCHIDIPVVTYKAKDQPPTQLTASDMLVQSITVAPAMATLDGPNTCAGFATPPLAILIGARLANPATDPLPLYSSTTGVPACDGMVSTTCAAATGTACICDQDVPPDGKPGATVAATGVPGLDDLDQVYLALRTVVSLKAQVYPPSPMQPTPGQRFKGTVENLMLEQSPLGCHHSPMGGGAPYDCSPTEVNLVVGLNPQISQSANVPSTFVAMPVADDESCAELIAAEGTLFNDQ